MSSPPGRDIPALKCEVRNIGLIRLSDQAFGRRCSTGNYLVTSEATCKR
jgi:hypothetical protein